MENLQEFEVKMSNGRKGTVLRTSRFLDKREFNTVKFNDGAEVVVPSAILRPQQDGSFYLEEKELNMGGQQANGANGEPHSAQTTAPAEAPLENEVTIDASLAKEDIEVQRIVVNRVLSAPAEIRIENGVTIVPIMEEVLKVEKQLILREEIRISKKRTYQRGPKVVSLRKDGPDAGSNSNHQR
jgi:stress response protein YsnF